MLISCAIEFYLWLHKQNIPRYLKLLLSNDSVSNTDFKVLDTVSYLHMQIRTQAKEVSLLKQRVDLRIPLKCMVGIPCLQIMDLGFC